MIPCSSPRAQVQACRAEILSAIEGVLDGGNYILGTSVEKFEAAFADYCRAAHAVGVNSGTDALTLSLRALECEGGEVIAPSHTALPTVAAIINAGAKPVLVDIEPESMTLDPGEVEKAIGKSTRAVIAVHLYGRPADMTAILEIAGRHGIKVVEDCAQSVGAKCGGRRVGSLGDAACFSFYPTKNLGAVGDGGMIVCKDENLARNARCLRQYGWNEKREPQMVGFNSRLDAMQAAILQVKLQHLDRDNARRREIAATYEAALGNSPLQLPAAGEGDEHVYHLYVVRHEERERLADALLREGVGTGVHYPVPCHLQQPYGSHARHVGSLANSEAAAAQVLSLPMYPELSDADVEDVCVATLKVLS